MHVRSDTQVLPSVFAKKSLGIGTRLNDLHVIFKVSNTHLETYF